MKINILKAEGAGVYEKLYLDATQLSLVSIIGNIGNTGRSNSAGKSTIYRLIFFALTGKDYSGENIDTLMRKDASYMKILLDFEFNGINYTIKRNKYRKTHPPYQAQLYMEDELVAEGVRSVNAEMENLLKMNANVLAATIFFVQGKLNSFTSQTPSVRKSYIADILSLDEWEKFYNVSKELEKKKLRELESIDKEIEYLHKLDDISIDYDSLIEENKKNKEYIEQFQDKQTKIRDDLTYSIDRLKQLGREHKELKESLNDTNIDVLYVDTQKYKQLVIREQSTYDYMVQNMESLESRILEHKETYHKGFDISKKISKINREIIEATEGKKHVQGLIDALQLALDKPTEKAACPLCKRSIIRTDQLVQARKADLYTYISKIEEGTKELEKYSTLKEEYSTLLIEKNSLESQIIKQEVVLNSAKDSKEKATQALEMYRKLEDKQKKRLAETRINEDELRGLIRSRAEVNDKVQEFKSKYIAAKVEELSLKERQQRQKETKEKLVEENKKKEVVRKDLEEFCIATKMFSRNYGGVQTYIIEEAIQRIQSSANDFLKEYGAGFTIGLDTVKYNKRNEPKETLDINIRTVDDEVRSYNVLCGAEKAQVDIALRFALSLLLCERYDVSFDSLFIDEALSSFDESNREITLKIFSSLNKRFQQIFVISHNSAIRDVMPQTIIVNKDEFNKSTLEVIE
jgi:DNA repair exonuclease SbcCD ATPase subunit